MKKELIIINGATGAVGSSLLEQFGQRKNAAIIGITRKAQNWNNFIDKELLFPSTFFCSVEFNPEEIRKFTMHIDFEKFSRVTYIHCVGEYLFEIGSNGDFLIENDSDADGINDLVMFLSYDVFRWFSENLLLKSKSHVDSVIFGGLADRHEPRILSSWWRTMKRVESFMSKEASEKCGMFKFDISSVLCPHELITRPFVFTHTNADQTAWLSPGMLAFDVIQTLNANRNGGFHKNDAFKRWEGFTANYYTDEQMVPRRISETVAK